MLLGLWRLWLSHEINYSNPVQAMLDVLRKERTDPMTDQKQAPERLVFKKEFFDMLDEQERNITGVYRIEEIEALVKQRDELTAENDRLAKAWQAKHDYQVKQSKDHADYFDKSQRRMHELVAERNQALAASAAREIAMRDRAAERIESLGFSAGLIRALPLSPDGQQALDDVRAEAWDDGVVFAINHHDSHTTEMMEDENPHRKESRG